MCNIKLRTFAPTARGRAAVARRAHNPKVIGSIPVLATPHKTLAKQGFCFFIPTGVSNFYYIYRVMSYDLMVFMPEAAPRTRPEFMTWYFRQTEWQEEHSYDDPDNCSVVLRSWFMDMIETFPALNGPLAIDEPDNYNVTDFCIGKDVIYAAFSWSVAEMAYETMKEKAEKHKVGFFDASAEDGDILFPDESGRNLPIDRPGNLSSIQQIRSWAKQGQENYSIRDIVFSRLNLGTESIDTPPKAKQKWWSKFFKFK